LPRQRSQCQPTKRKKEKKRMKTKLTFTLLASAAVSINLHAATSALPAPLPEFMDDAQAAKWTADQEATAKTAAATQEVSTQFYTGKPYVADVGGYIFKYRAYNPEMSRWTTSDPSGFRDGANNMAYAPTPTMQFDPNGLAKMTSYTGTLDWYDGNPRPETFTENFSDYYSDVNYQPTDFDGFLTQFNSASDGTTIDIVKNYNWGDAYAIGRGNLELNGIVSVEDGVSSFSGQITIQDDTFDFNPDPSRTWYNEALTVLLANTAFNPALGGSSFNLTFSGSQPVSYE
jgi:RHS repeat-associated protein